MKRNSIEQCNSVPWKISDVIFSYLFIFSLSIFSIGLLFAAKISNDNIIFSTLIQISLSLVSFAIVYFIISRKYHSSFKQNLGIYKKDLSNHLSIGVFIALLLVLSTSMVSIGANSATGGDGDPYANMSSDKLKMISLLAVFLAPIVEEIFFRGFMQPAMVQSFGTFGGILITSLIFAFSHSQYLDYSQALISITLIGIILGITRQLTGSVMPGIFAHFINNLFAVFTFLS